MKIRFVLVLCLSALAAPAWAQELLCPDTGIPMSQDPGCTTPNYGNPGYEPQQQQPQYQPRWVDSYGAIAYGHHPTRGDYYHSATNYRSEGEAQSVALQGCKATGSLNCRVAFTFWNGYVAVVGTSDGHFFNGAAGSSASEAEASALGYCRQQGGSQCRVVKTLDSLSWQE